MNPNKSELMYRMDALRAAGLVPDMALLADTLTVRNGQPHLIVSAAWLAIYNDNLTVHFAYDQDKYGTGTNPTSGATGTSEPAPTITPRPPPEHQPKPKHEQAVLVTTWQRLLDKPQPPEPLKERKPMSNATLIATARGVAAQFRLTALKEKAPDDAHVAWLLDALADRLEQHTDNHDHPDQHQKE